MNSDDRLLSYERVPANYSPVTTFWDENKPSPDSLRFTVLFSLGLAAFFCLFQIYRAFFPKATAQNSKKKE
jgi:hypothetical protein